MGENAVSQEFEDRNEGYQIAIVGMSGRFPGAPSPAALWENLKRGLESVHFFSDEELLRNGESPENLADPNYVRAWPVLENMDHFDAGFFGMSPRDAAVMDPQHRLFLMVAWEALERAGYEPERTLGPVGVFAACGMNHYMMYHLVTNQEVMQTVGEWLVRHNGNDMNFLATRTSYQMNLKGPSLNVQTACSSALTAVHLACQSLLAGECDYALAGASTLSLPQDRGYVYKPGEILSPDGHCRPFDAGSHGTLFGSGTGCVVLRRLADAERDGDTILAVIRGSAINNDGAQKVGYLAPSVEGQARAISEALAISGVHAETIGYVETHGTGTAVGDPIEVRALNEAFAPHTSRRGFCAIGSLKANIGHLGEAAGIAGLIKTVLSLRHGQVVPSINYSQPNPEIDFARSPFRVNTALADFPIPTPGFPARAGITALGAGGTNVHLILEAAPVSQAKAGEAGPELVVLSARSDAALLQAKSALADHLNGHEAAPLADVAYTLAQGRKAFNKRLAFVARDRADAVAALLSPDPKRIQSGTARSGKNEVAFMFPGGGAQYAGMGAALYSHEPVYRKAVDECLSALDSEHRKKVSALLLERVNPQQASQELERPSLALPALFATEYAMARLLMSLGLEPVSLIGHSMGEYVAASLAEVFSAADGMGLVTRRGRLFETLPEGTMLSVQLPEQELRRHLSPELSIAAENAPELSVASGPVAAIQRLEQILNERGVETQRIHISVAAHSSMLEPILREFESYCRSIRFHTPKRPFISNLTGSWVDPEQVKTPGYWVAHLRSTVRFNQGISTLLAEGNPLLLEVGPGRTLASLARQQPNVPFATPTMRHPRESAEDREFLLESLGRLWVAGGELDFSALMSGARRRVPLPTYPFELKRYFIPANANASAQAAKVFRPHKQAQLESWFGKCVFRELAEAGPTVPARRRLFFTDKLGLHRRLEAGSPENIHVSPGERFLKLSADRYMLRVDAREDYAALFEDLEATQRLPDQIVHLFGVTPNHNRLGLSTRSAALAPEAYEGHEAHYFKSLLYLSQEVAKRELELRLDVVTSQLHKVGNDPAPHPEKALVLGAVRVLPRELPSVRTRCIDVSCDRGSDAELDRLAQELADELSRAPAPTHAADPIVALRGGMRFVQEVIPAKPVESSSEASISGAPVRVRPRGVYLITGGFGGLGLTFAKHLALQAHARLVLVGRTVLPSPAERARYLAEHTVDDPIARKLRAIQELEAAGADVMLAHVDAADFEQMSGLRERIRERFGKLDGILHAAGTLDDTLISLKTEDSARRVLASKVKSTLVLDRVFGRDRLDFVVLFSSVSSVLGLEGQIDYTAANAFLDAYANAQLGPGRPLTISIGWNAWQEVGMAVEVTEAARPGGVTEHGRIGPHPCLERIAVDTPEEMLFVTRFTRVRHWPLGEHVVRGGAALLPGTGYLELSRAGLSHALRTRALELENVAFLSPFTVGEGESRDLRLRLTLGAGDQVRFTFFSESEREPHATGSARPLSKQERPAVDLAALRERLRGPDQQIGGFLPQPFMDFGPRWANVESVRLSSSDGAREALIELKLAALFSADLASYELHPALLDMATGGAQALVPGFDGGRDFLVPLSYGKVRLVAPLTSHVFSHVRLRTGNTPALVSFDVTIHGAQGEVLVEIENFCMTRVDQGRFAALPASGTGVTSATLPTERSAGLTRAPRAHESPRSQLSQVVAHGILPSEGVQVFERLLKQPRSGHWIASSVPIAEWLRSVDAKTLEARAASQHSSRPADPSAALNEDGETSRAVHANYVAPRNELELELSELFSELLGVQHVGIHDDFFELGGQSLVAVRLFNKIRRKHAVDLPLSTLFEAPTVAQCAEVIASELGITPAPLAIAANANAGPESTSASGPATMPSSPPPAPGAEDETPPPSLRFRASDSAPPPPAGPNGVGSGDGGDAASGDAAHSSGQASHVRRTRWRSLVPMQPHGELPPIFCVAGMGGTLNNLRKLALLAGDQRPFYGLQPPGADGQTEILYTVEALAEHYISEISSVCPDGPYLLGGYSGGGVAAFEIAKQLEARGKRVAFVGLIDSFSPHLPTRPFVQRARMHAKRVIDRPSYLVETLGRRLTYESWNLGRVMARNLGKVFPERYRYEQLADSWVLAEQRYRPTPWNGQVHLFRAREESALTLWTALEVDERYGWSRYALGGVHVELCPGNHSTMCEEPNVRVLAAKLKEAVNRASPAPATYAAEVSPAA
ncbi:MAG TPA: SDR family NAD(P)-dependent oxidoreductase [Polyangiaceae bacterium]|nr:SDR family NAD(P)-dependent oxidoreductase [Polyangiaceae bacterium]